MLQRQIMNSYNYSTHFQWINSYNYSTPLRPVNSNNYSPLRLVLLKTNVVNDLYPKSFCSNALYEILQTIHGLPLINQQQNQAFTFIRLRSKATQL